MRASFVTGPWRWIVSAITVRREMDRVRKIVNETRERAERMGYMSVGAKCSLILATRDPLVADVFWNTWFPGRKRP